MGQGSSRGSAEPLDRSSQRPSAAPRPFARRNDSRSTLDASSTSRSSRRSFNPFTRLRSDPADAGPSASTDLPHRRTRLTRSHSSISNILGRRRSPQSREPSSRTNSSRLGSSLWPSSSQQNSRETSSSRLPRIPIPDLDLSFDDFTEALDTESVVSSPARERQDSERRRNSILERISGSMVPERGASRMRNSLRRRRSPLQRNEDNAAMLSRLLSVAAAATAASLMGDEHRAGAETRNFMSGDEDGTFDSFLQSLQNGRIASALRGNSVAMDDGQGPSATGQAPLNFFRMFRFGNANSNSARTETGSRRPSSNRSGESDAQRNGGEAPTNRMVPVIIVGIRSITPASGSREQQDENIPPFLDALHGFPAPSASPGDPAVDGVGVLRQPHNGTRFSHRRRASMGGVTALPSTSPSPRPQRSVERPRPWSTLSDSASGPRPPPSTPASQGLSAFPSGATTPTFTPPATTPMAQSAAPSRRESFVRSTTRTSNGLESTAEEPPSPTQQRTARHRRLSESDFTRFGAGSARRNGVVEPDHTPGEGPRSWIIYVLGGSYPEDHPILTTPSLFTDTPTYEDMMLLSTFLGPAKPPVASEDDVASAGGLYTVQAGPSGLEAVSPDNNHTVVIAAEQRCLVCLCDFEVKEEARQLVKCGHLFHKECIDQWLTTGRNSCPLCRGQGVDEKEQPQSSPSSPATSPSTHPETDEGLAIPIPP